MDDTLTKPNLDFDEMYKRCGVPKNEDILTAIQSMDPSKASKARSIIEEMEEEGRRTLELCNGALEVGRWLNQHNVPIALVTRNTRKTVNHMVDTLWMPAGGVAPFQPALTRDEDLPHKPDPASLQQIARQWGMDLPNQDLLMVGDSLPYDVGFGKSAGIATALIDNKGTYSESNELKPDICVSNLADLPLEIWKTFQIPGRLGSEVMFQKRPIPSSQNPASKAAMEGDIQTLTSLPPSELTNQDETGNTPLIWASDAGHIETVRELLTIPGININTKGYLGNTAVSRASRRGYADIIQCLAQSGKADLNLPNEKLQYPLHFAAFKKNMEAVKVLLEFGADTYVFDRKGRTPKEDTSCERINEVISAHRLLLDK